MELMFAVLIFAVTSCVVPACNAVVLTFIAWTELMFAVLIFAVVV
jgi:hypothetical protein